MAKSSASGIAKTLALLLGIASMGLAGFAVWIMLGPGQGKGSRVVANSTPAASPSTPADGPKQPWLASAPGRVEPRAGLVRITPASMGRIVALPAKLNDRVIDGQLLLVMEDKEARSRLIAAEAEAAARKRERDAAPATAGRENINRAEDNLYFAERALSQARLELDDAMLADTRGNSPAVASSRRRHSDAIERLRQETANLTNSMRNNAPAPNRVESAVLAARSDVMAADLALDRTRMRAPGNGSILQINVKLGETLAPSPEQVVFLMGDVSRLRVRAEVDETDVPKVRAGQGVFIKNSAYPGQEFEGKVAEISSALIIPRMGARGPRRASDVEVMEVLIDLEGTVSLVSGMRVDVFFR